MRCFRFSKEFEFSKDRRREFAHHGEPTPITDMFFLQELELDNLVSENPIYAKVFHEFQDNWGKPGVNIQTIQTNSQDPEISHLAVGLLTLSHQISKIHA